MTLVTPIIQRWIDEGRRDPDGLWERAAEDLPCSRLADSHEMYGGCSRR
jgi:hypothetical protein